MNSIFRGSALFAAALFMSCGGVARVTVPAGTKALLGDAWYEARSRQLGMTFDEARSRDRLISNQEPPEPETLDKFTREQGAALWVEHCSKCHGLDGVPPPLDKKPHSGEPPREWGTMGTSMGFFFGGDKMRAGIFKTIFDGGTVTDSAMPAWGEMLGREQIWALVYHIESF